jgi:TolA-binding protein
MLTKMPDSRSPWRAWTVLIDADALAAQGRHVEAQTQLDKLFATFPEHPAVVPGNQLLAWSYAQQGDDDRAIAIEERMLRRYATSGSTGQLATARLNIGHVRFNQRRYQDAAKEYEAYLQIVQEPAQQLLPLYQLGLCYQRLGRSGDSVDRWERLVQLQPNAAISEKAWARAGDVYFAAGHYDNAARCYQGLLENFAGSAAAATGMLRLAQCSYNAGDDATAIERYSEMMDRFPRSEEAVEARNGLELALYRLGQSAKGVDALAQLVERYPGSSFAADAQFQIASQLYEAKDYVRAAEEFRRVVSQFPNSPNVDRAQLLAADSYAAAGQKDAAKSAYEQFTMLFSSSELIREARFRLGSMYFETEDYLRTALEFSQVLEGEKRDELSEAALFNLAICQKLLGDAPASLASFQRYREWFGDDERALDIAMQTAQIHRAMQQPEAAKAEFARALQSGADGATRLELQFELGGLQEELGETDAALDTYEKAMKSSDRANPFRISAVARCAAIYEDKEQYSNALKAYRDLARNAEDAELRAAAEQRAKELEAFAR